MSEATNIDAMIDRTLELDRNATKGDWHIEGEDQFATVCEPDDNYRIVAKSHTLLDRHTGEVDMDGVQHVRNMTLIAAYRTLCPTLARELRETRERLKKLEDATSLSLFSGVVIHAIDALNELREWREAKEGKVTNG